ncbi:augmin complex subunit dgt5-like [Diachasmimorpha longicaudata]|uniref:augmin complex subunit dgt5-like n=1 Tax=Diachasmimorpha longicaudata TaxID=58733 RepID=UPI0030B91C03
MPKTVEIVNNFEWAETLGCPPSACSDHVKKIFNHGITGLWWEEIGSKIHPVNDVLETRKNILLYYLKSQGQTPAIQHIRNTKRLRSERCLLETQVINLQSECEKRENSIKEKVLKLQKIRATKKALETKKSLLNLSHHEMKEKMRNCRDMRAVCQDLLPSSQSGIDPTTMNESLTLVGGISSRADKSKAWKQIQETLGPIAIPELWDWILKNRIRNNEELCKLGIDESDTKKTISQLDLEIASARGRQLKSAIAKCIQLEKAKEYEARGSEYLEQISAWFDDNEEMDKWLMTTMEVTKFEATQKVLQSEMEKMKHFSEEQNAVSLELHELESEINEIDYQMQQRVQTLHRSLGLLQSASNFLLILKDNLTVALESIRSLSCQHEAAPDRMNGHLSHELEVFQENLDVNALNKIVLSGKVGAYRHATTCMSNASISFTTLTSATPVLQPALYHLITCYLDIIANKYLKQKKEESMIANQLEISLKSSLPSFAHERDIIELLDEGNSRGKKCREEISELTSIFDSWCSQPVAEVMAINDSLVHGATFNEWLQRYTTLIYMLQRSK